MHIDVSIGRQGNVEKIYQMQATKTIDKNIDKRLTSSKFNFNTGVNRGAEILADEMRQLIERDGYAD